ncbi:hypothetical protein M1271_07350 [Patescibacteria group bacterium]|nr:hypothetical protein [Patescibacteria group bacterium]MCL5797427.1 hypothetical protein [Patescibacteria group bacterium]
MKLKSLFIFSALFFFSVVLPGRQIYAIYDPLSLPNNKYGIHIIDENDMDNAAKLVNSAGGDWGYVTMVITQNDRDTDKWNKIFDQLRNLHLIPIIRLATFLNGYYWEKPTLDQVLPWAQFLNRLHWVVKNRYIVVFNEPNHAKEWGGEINPASYSDILSSMSASLKTESPDFFILPAGLDASAPNAKDTMDEKLFIQEMLRYNHDIYNFVDGWTSHSYPNPGYVGGSDAVGRGTVRTFQWEETLLKSLGIERQLPVFITETGWPHQDGNPYNPWYFSPDEVSDLILQASKTVWTDKNIVAITPFVLNYQSYPFSNFSWQKEATSSFYPQYDSYQKLVKTAGKPVLDMSYKKILGEETTAKSTNSSMRRLPVKTSKHTFSDNFLPMMDFLSHLPFIGPFISKIF